MSVEHHDFRILDHTADVGLEAHGHDLAELFSNAARGMFSIIVSLKSIRPGKDVQIKVSAENLENLLVNWLSELLYLSSTQMVLFSRFEIAEIDDNHISAKALGESIDQSRHELYTEIKAVTYHELKVEKRNQRWCARVLFDI